MKPLAWPRRLLLGALAWVALFLLGPGLLPRFLPALALAAPLAVAGWGLVVARPTGGRPARAFLAEWLAASIGWAGSVYWIAYVFGPALLGVALGMGFYGALAGWLVRRLVRRWPLAPAVALGWFGAESLRALLPPPFGLGWLRLGHHLIELPGLLGGARVLGIEGLSLVGAGLAGAVAGSLARGRPGRVEAATGFVPLLGMLLAGLASPAPATTEGPRVLLVQPGFDQARKQFEDPRVNFEAGRELTRAAAAELPEPPDLVCWGESMLYVTLLEPGVADAIRAGAPLSPSLAGTATPLVEWLPTLEALEADRVRGALLGLERTRLGGPPAIPPGAWFLTGAEVLGLDGSGTVRRRNAVVLYAPDGSRSPSACKQYLVPGAETLLGLERFGPAREVIFAIAAYVPDFEPGEGTTVLELGAGPGDGTRAGWRLAASVCFDNAFLGPYTEPLLEGPVDFHFVASNEAWYRTSWEMDQMVAFSRVVAAATARSFVRATNSGVSCVLDPRGRELARIRSGGRDRAVGGTLSAVVPVPARDDGDPGPTAYCRLRLLLRPGAALLPWLVLLLFRLRSGNPRPAPG